MDLPTFLIEALKVNGSVLSAWAWPVAFITCAVIFKREVRSLINRIRSFKGAGVEAAFEERLEVLEEAPEVPLPAEVMAPAEENQQHEGRRNGSPKDGAGTAVEGQSDSSRSSEDLVASPNASESQELVWDTVKRWHEAAEEEASTYLGQTTESILLNWRFLESAVRKLYAVAVPAESTGHKTVFLPFMLRTLVAQGVIEKELDFKIAELRALRNIAVRGDGELSQTQIRRYVLQARQVRRTLFDLISRYQTLATK